MNVIFKRFEGEENWPHLIETPKETGVYEFDISPENKKNLENRILSAKANAVPFKKEDRGEITNECWYSETKDLPNPHENYWQPDPEKIYSIDGRYEIKKYFRHKRIKDRTYHNDGWLEGVHEWQREKKYIEFRQFAILLKKETVKEHDCTDYAKINCTCAEGICKIKSNKEADKEESQDTLMNELMNAWRLGANIKGLQSKFHITRIK